MTKVKGGSWVWNSKLGKLVPKSAYYAEPDAPMVMKPLEPFVSPITRELITDRSHLRAHNEKHGVTDSRDYSADWYAKKGKERNDRIHCRTPEQKAERIEALKQAIWKQSHQ